MGMDSDVPSVRYVYAPWWSRARSWTSHSNPCLMAAIFAYHLECSGDAISGCRSSSKGRGERWEWGIFGLVVSLDWYQNNFEKFSVREFKGGRRRLALGTERAGPCFADAEADFNASGLRQTYVCKKKVNSNLEILTISSS